MLPFLRTLRDKFDTIGVSKVAAVRELAYFLGGNNKDVPSEQFPLVEVDFDGECPEDLDQGSWLHVVKALWRRFLTDIVLCKAHDAVSKAE